MKEGRKGEAGGEGTSRREEGEKERQTERKRDCRKCVCLGG